MPALLADLSNVLFTAAPVRLYPRDLKGTD
jgi:hypothetical protein